MKVTFFSTEVAPLAKTGGLGDVCGALPLALEKQGIEVVIILPHYLCIRVNQASIRQVNEHVTQTRIGKNIKVYLINHAEYFDREGIYGDKKGDYKDNLERFHFFSQAALELLKTISFQADIIHCHDWPTALIPVLLKTKYKTDPFYQNMKSVLTIHNISYQGIFPKNEAAKLDFIEDGLMFNNRINFLHAGIMHSDCVSTVSPQYAKEIQEKEFGCGLEGTLRKRKNPVIGILNGLDETTWNSESDRFIEKTYNKENCTGKQVNKKKLQETAQLPADADIPLFGFIGRLVEQKGLVLLKEALAEILKLDLQLIFLGVGEERFEHFLSDLARQHPQKMATFLDFNETKAHQMYAGCDFLLMPSAYEPCGLNQMISLHYGTIPIVSDRGGLVDTVKPLESAAGNGNGFVMPAYDAKTLIREMERAVEVFKRKDDFRDLIARAFQVDFSWEKSAQDYVRLYRQCLS
ncbi:MAG: glycogen/starch synthase [Candidatus Omnitrophota bacterium]